MNRSPQTEDKYVVRFPEGMRDSIKAAAEANNRSMNAEIIARLQVDPATAEPNLEYERCKIELKHCKETCEILEKALAENNDRFWQLARLFENHNEIFIDNTNILISLLSTIKERGEKEGSVEPALIDSCLSIVKMLVKLNVKKEIPE